MRRPRLGAWLLGIAVGAGLAAGAVFLWRLRAPLINAPPPAVVDDVLDSLPAPPVSVVESEVRYDLEPALQALEKAVPRAFGNIDDRRQMGTNNRAQFAFAAERGPFDVDIRGQRITISGIVEYEGRGWYRPFIGPTISAACGTGGVDRPRALVRIVSTLALTSRWTLRSRSRVDTVMALTDSTRDRCRVTPLHIDVTDRVLGATRSLLESQLSRLDQNVSQLPTRKRFEQWWRAMERPIKLTDSVYFLINPVDVALGRIDIDSGMAIARLRLEARPRIVSGYRPNDFEQFHEIPALRMDRVLGQGLQVTLEGAFGYDVASAMLRKALVGKRIRQGRRWVRIRALTLTGIGGGRVALGLRFDGSVRGLVYFTGTPQYDPQAEQLSVPDLTFDVPSGDLLVRGVAWLQDDWIRDYLRDAARLPLADQLDRLRQLAEKGMNRDLAPGVTLVAEVRRAEGVGVRATRRALLLRATASGSARLEIDKAPVVRRPAEVVVPQRDTGVGGG